MPRKRRLTMKEGEPKTAGRVRVTVRQKKGHKGQFRVTVEETEVIASDAADKGPSARSVTPA
jgi:hypothetical protein